MMDPQIRRIFLDAGNTILYVNMKVVSQRLADRGLQRTPEELWHAEHRARRVLDDPDLVRKTNDSTRWHMYFERILREAGIDSDAQLRETMDDLLKYHESRNLWEVVPPEIPPTLDRLAERCRLGVISNANGTVRAILQRVGLAHYFDIILDSHEEGVEKPDPRIFRIAMERAGVQPSETLYVGDLYHVDVAGARAAGMHAILLDPAGNHADKPVRRVPTLPDILG